MFYFFVGLVLFIFSSSLMMIRAQTKGTLSYEQQNREAWVYREQNEDYISSESIAGVLKARLYHNPQKKKTVFYLPDAEIKLTAFSAFVVVNEKSIYQMPAEVLWRESAVWVPVRHFLSVINRILRSPLIWYGEKMVSVVEIKKDTVQLQKQKDTNAVLSSVEGGGNIRSIEWSRKKNGYLITLSTNKAFDEQDLALWQNKQWVYLTVSGGLPTAQIRDDLNRLIQSGIIRKALLFEHQRSVQFSFHLSRTIEGQELLNESRSGKIHVLLRLPVSDEETKSQKQNGSAQKDKRWVIDKIVIDAGHGGKDPGAIGKGKTKEKDITLAIALYLGRLIEERLKIQVAYTRTTDEFISLKNRTRFANNQNAKLFISIHCNASKRRSASGFETFFLSPSRNEEAQAVAVLENEAIQYEEERHEYGDFTNEKFILASMMQSVFVKESEELADYIQKGLAGQLTLKNRGVSQGPFYVLMGASMPSVLVETGFISNKTEEKYLKSEAGQRAIAEGILNGLKKFIEQSQ